jgi:2-aminoadipate transaminase
VISFARGAPAPECLAVELIAACARDAVERDGTTVLSYGPVGGYAPLREWIADRHAVDPKRVLLTNGSLQGVQFLLELLLSHGPALVEAPTYDRPLKQLAWHASDVETMPVDEEGLDVDALDSYLEHGRMPGLVYTIPTFQNPSGRTLSLERRRRLAQHAVDGLLVLEDDPYGLVRYEGEALPSIFELANGTNVIYSSSFSKTISPGLRVGYFVLPEELATRVEEIAVSTYITPALLSQATVMEFIRQGHFEPNLERIRGLLKVRRDAMLAALERELGGRATWSRPEGGYFLWIDLPVDTGALLARAEAMGVTFVRGSDFFYDGGGERSARLAFSFASPSEIDEGISVLSALLRA